MKARRVRGSEVVLSKPNRPRQSHGGAGLVRFAVIYFVAIGMLFCLFLASPDFGSVTVKTPLL